MPATSARKHSRRPQNISHKRISLWPGPRLRAGQAQRFFDSAACIDVAEAEPRTPCTVRIADVAELAGVEWCNWRDIPLRIGNVAWKIAARIAGHVEFLVSCPLED